MCERYDAAKVQLVRAVPLRHGGFHEWLGRRTTGICHADINPAKMAVNIVDKLTHAFVFRNVKCGSVDFDPVQAPRLFCDEVQGLGLTSADGEFRAFRGESKRCGTTNSFARCGNNGDAISESCFHEVSININSVRVVF